MILWLTGQTGSGKTTLALKLQENITQSVVLDGDDMRNIWKDLGFSKLDRLENNKRIFELAIILQRQGFTPIISVICPFEEFRKNLNTKGH